MACDMLLIRIQVPEKMLSLPVSFLKIFFIFEIIIYHFYLIFPPSSLSVSFYGDFEFKFGSPSLSNKGQPTVEVPQNCRQVRMVPVSFHSPAL